MTMLSYRLSISGDVQGVGFRAGVYRTAIRFQVRGQVRNDDDGTVEVILQGPKTNVDNVIDWCRIGPPTARVQAVKIDRVELDPFDGFKIL